MKYKIGDVARILGVSPDILRYYEKKGVVAPAKGENNDYRYYDAWDINFLMDCLWFKNFGFSIEQIADIVHISSVTELDGMLADKETELRETIARAQLQLRRMEEHRQDLECIDRLLYRCEISDSPEFVRFINRVGNEYDIGGGLKGLARQWLKALPFNHRYFEMNADAPLPGSEESYRWGFSLTREYVDALQFEVVPPMAVIPSRKSIHTIFKNSGGRGCFAPSLLQYALNFADERDIRIFGPICGVLLASVMENDVLTGYFEAWLPIE